MSLTRHPLFDESERQEIQHDIVEWRQKLEAKIAKHPDQRQDLELQFNQLCHQYVQARAHSARKTFFLAALTASGLGVAVVILGCLLQFGLLVAFGICAALSGLVTAVLNIPTKRT